MYIADLIADMLATKRKIQDIGQSLIDLQNTAASISNAMRELPGLDKKMYELRRQADKLLSVKTYIDNGVIYASICGDIYELRNTGAFTLSKIQNPVGFDELFQPCNAVRKYYPIFDGVNNPLFIFDGYELDFSDRKKCRIFFHGAKLNFINGGAYIEL